LALRFQTFLRRLDPISPKRCSCPMQASVNLRNLLADSRIRTSSRSIFSSTLFAFRRKTCSLLLVEVEAPEVSVEGRARAGGGVLVGVVSRCWRRRGVEAMELCLVLGAGALIFDADIMYRTRLH
jgi:hypothetical protein